MLTARLASFDCTDHDPIEAWVPDSEVVLYSLTLHIGRPDVEGAELFQVPVANHAGLKSSEWQAWRRRAAPPIVVDPYDWDAVLAEVRRRIEDSSHHEWASVWERLREHFSWEYEGMSPDG